MKDNINNEIHIGDSVFCYSGSLKYTIQTVIGFRGDYLDFDGDDYSYGNRGVTFKGGFWLSAENVVSLNSLGVNIEVDGANYCVSQSDALGNPLHIGDKVLYRHPLEEYCDIGIIKSMSPKSCLLMIKKNRFEQEEYRKKYEELISLTALGIDSIPQRNVFGKIKEQYAERKN